MDKYEYKLKLDQMKSLTAEGKYDEAAEIVDTINWRKIKNINALVKAGEIYEKVGRYDESKEILLAAYDRSPIGRMIIYRLAQVAIKTKNFDEAKEYYQEFVEIAPHDNLKYVLKYEICKAQGSDLPTQIAVLEELKEQEYSEEWAYELACLYHKAGMSEKCIDACDELILWFGDGPYVERALELKMLYQPLTKQQEDKYRMFRQRHEGIVEVRPEDTLESGEIVPESVQIPQVKTPERFNTQNLQEELQKSMREIMNATEKETVSDTMDNIKKLVEDIPYLQIPVEKEAEDAGEETVHIETDEEIDDSLKSNFQEMLVDEDGQMSLYVPGGNATEPQVSGQMSIEDVLAEWEKTKRAAEAALYEAEQRKLESAKARALQEAEDLMNRLADVIPKLDSGLTPKDLLEEQYLGTDGEQPVNDRAAEMVVNMNQILQQEIDRLSDENAQMDEQLAAVGAAQVGGYVVGAEETAGAALSEASDMVSGTAAAAAASAAVNATASAASSAALAAEEASAGVQEAVGLAEADAQELVAAGIRELMPQEDTEDAVSAGLAAEIRNEIAAQSAGETSGGADEEPDGADTAQPDDLEAGWEDEDFEELDAVTEQPETVLTDTVESAILAETKRQIASDEKEEDEDLPKIELPQDILSDAPKAEELPKIAEPEAFETPDTITKLSKEQREIFSYFVPISGMEQQLCQALTGASQRLSRGGSAGTGNMIVQGGPGSGKTVLATSIVKALQKETGKPSGKIGKIEAAALNKKDAAALLKKVAGGCLIIEKAGDISRETAVRLSLLLGQDQSGVLVILEDTKHGIEKALSKDEGFAAKFTEKINIPIFTSDELVTFAKSYANELGYTIEEMGILALYNCISNIEHADRATTLTEVKDIVDRAVRHSEKGGLKKAFGILTSRRYDEDDYIILREKDFDL